MRPLARLVLALVLGGPAAAQDAPRTTAVSTAPAPGNGASGLAEERLWTEPAAAYDGLYEVAVLGRSPRLVIDAPRTVDLGARDGVPLIVFFADRQRDAWGVALERDAVVVVSRLEDGACWAATLARAVGDDDEERPDPSSFTPPAGPPPDPAAIVEQFVVGDLRQVPGIPWQAGTYDARVLLGARASNLARVRLEPGAPSAAADAPATGAAPAASPPLEAPLPADGPGLGLAVPSVVAHGDPLLVAVAVRVPRSAVAARDLATVPVHVVVTGVGGVGPFVAHLRVPVAGEALMTGQLRVDLLEVVPRLRALEPQRLSLHAFSGDLHAGGVTLDVVAR